ncbi:MAG: hypothetical protein COV31_01515 [Candidatus Yanofskybacteria bacterium CG10_big_fil_rev_8_21_14_0_10_46_23]|uniref:Uncharacterized protein n=1 Tax=Candidatus Yanofskybacteria bacterium CG10_big_fil_rev_8_21_14_0_10_46_23 TaxID=1975098 RepID=A0A2H0R4C2_9BACT|nr:MAG: hypothetical protein COV31_01515 [Candidatus Yanofskybacteria bacterium CG10_big_fil_rev_8_21_14_0_10_46_23]
MVFNLKKILAGTLILISALIFLVAPTNPQSAEGTDFYYATKEYSLDVVARVIAANLLNTVSNQVLDVIQGAGRDGQPAFVLNWREFILDSDRRGQSIFLSQLRYVIDRQIVCEQLRGVVGGIFGAQNGTPLDIGQFASILQGGGEDSFQVRSRCTIPKEVYADYQEDFLKGGGWETFKRIVEPQNNVLGLTALSFDELAKQKGLESQADTSETRSTGFISSRGNCRANSDRLHGNVKTGETKCLLLGNVVTPAQILTEAGARTVDSQFDWLTSSDELSEVITGVINAAYARLTSFLPVDLTNLTLNDTTQVESRNESLNQATQRGVQTCVQNCLNIRESACSTASNEATCRSSARRACQDQCAFDI